MKRAILYFTFWAGAMLALAGCVRDPMDGGTDGAGSVPVTFNVVVPGGADGATRAITANEEQTIQTVNVFVFKINADGSEIFDYIPNTASVAQGNTAGAQIQTITTTLQKTTYQQRIVLILNAADQAHLTAEKNWRGATKAQVMADLKLNLNAAEDRWNATSPTNYKRMPMWGESAPETITAGTVALSQTIRVVRMVARVDVKLDTTVAGLTDRFKLKSVSLYNTNTGGHIVPEAAKVVSDQNSVRVNATTIPTELQPYSARKRGPIKYIDFSAPGVTDISMIGAIYTFEAANSANYTEATAIVVGGLYGSDTAESFYRLDFTATNASTTRLDLMRNHQYVFNITSVTGRGNATADDAFNSRAVNMTASVLAWNGATMDNVVFDGQNILATNKDQVSLSKNAYTAALATGENVIQVTTDVAAGWTVAATNNDGSTPPSWARLSPASGAAGATTSVAVIADENPSTTAPRTGVITLSAGRLRLPITITQSQYPALSLRIVNDAGQEIQSLVWHTATAGTAPAGQNFTVNWLPATNPVSVAATQTARWEFPNPGGNPAVQDNAPYANMPWTEQTGTKSFNNINPPALTPAELAADPFMQKSSRFDFTVGNGQSTTTKSITLTSLQYNLRVEQSSSATSSSVPANPMLSPWYAQLGGRRFTYNVRSNSTWKISAINETHLSSYNNNGSFFASTPTAGDNVSQNAAGTPNTTPGGGYRELFTTTNSRRGESGYADIVYSSDPAGRFADVTQRIFFPSAQFKVYGIVKFGDSNAHFYNIFAGTNNQANTASSRDNHIHNMIRNGGANFNNYATNIANNVPSSTVFTGLVDVNGANINSTDNITVDEINAAVNAGADMLFISGSSKFGDDVAAAIANNFLKKDKPVFLAIEDGDSVVALWKQVLGGGNILWKSNSTLNGSAPVYQFQNPNNGNDPLINGPFKINGSSLANRYWGCDGTGSIAFWFTDNSGSTHTTNNMVVYSNARNQSGGTDSPPQGPNFSNQTMDNGYTCFRFTHVPLVFAADGGFAGCFDTSSTRAPATVNTTNGVYTPGIKSGYGGGGTKQDSANAYFMANVIAWAIQRRSTQ